MFFRVIANNINMQKFQKSQKKINKDILLSFCVGIAGIAWYCMVLHGIAWYYMVFFFYQIYI